MATMATTATVQMPLLLLSDDQHVQTRMLPLMQILLEHKLNTARQLQSLGFVLPTRTFFENEERRYTNIFSANTQHSSRLAAPRELLQNSSDAFTDRFTLSTLHVRPGQPSEEEVLLQVCQQLECCPLFVRFEDTGVWCPAEEEGTYLKCMKYFLSMNGSGKDQVSAGGLRQDGGFGVGRMVILFCAPFWVFTARHLLVLGHFNQFRILCRRCWATVKDACCEQCGLRERETPVGTTFLINYKHFRLPLHLQQYEQLMHTGYYKFCRVKFPLVINQQVVVPFGNGVTIHRGRTFVVSKIEFGEDETKVAEIYSVCKKFCYGIYMVRTASGVPMFTKIIYSDETEKGMFYVDLDASVTFKDFDQSRQALQNAAGREFDVFIAERSNNKNSCDIDHDFEHHVSGLEPLIEVVQAATTSTPASTRAELRSLPNSEEKHDGLDLWPGFLRYTMKFTGGRNLTTMHRAWLPGKSWEQIYLLVLWTEVLNRVVPEYMVDRFNVGLMFSANAEAMLETLGSGQYVFYLDPEHLQTEVLAEEEEEVENPSDKLRLTFDLSHRERLVATVISDAVHEVTHLDHKGHNAQFSSSMNMLFTKVLMARVFERILDLDNQLRTVAKRLFVQQSGQQRQAEVNHKKRKCSASAAVLEDPL